MADIGMTDLIGPIVGAIAGAAFTIAGMIYNPRIRRWLIGPKLKISFGDSQEYQRITKLRGQTEDTIFIRIKVTNSNPTVAEGCQPYLGGVEVRHEDGSYSDNQFCDCIPLAWSAHGEKRHKPIDIPRWVNQYVDLVSATEGTSNFGVHLRNKLNRYENMFHEGHYYRFKVQVSAKNADPVFIKIEFQWLRSCSSYIAKEAKRESPLYISRPNL